MCVYVFREKEVSQCSGSNGVKQRCCCGAGQPPTAGGTHTHTGHAPPGLPPRGAFKATFFTVSRQLIGRGRYGTVFRGLLADRCVAVKLFTSANRQTFTNERSIYSLPLLQQHANVARFLSAEQRTSGDGRPEFLIVMDFYPQVSSTRVSSWKRGAGVLTISTQSAMTGSSS